MIDNLTVSQREHTFQKRLPEVIPYESILKACEMALEPAQVTFTAASASFRCNFLELGKAAVICCFEVLQSPETERGYT